MRQTSDREKITAVQCVFAFDSIYRINYIDFETNARITVSRLASADNNNNHHAFNINTRFFIGSKILGSVGSERACASDKIILIDSE